MNLPSILDNIVSLFKPKGETVLGVDIGGSSIKVVQVRNKAGQAILETYGEVALGPYVGMDIGRAVKLHLAEQVTAIKDVLKEANSTTKICGLAVPITSSLITTMKVPEIAGGNLEDIVTMEARRYIPVSMQEITLDWQIIPDEPVAIMTSGQNPTMDFKSGNAKTSGEVANKIKSAKVLIVAVRTEIIEKLKETAVSAGLDYRFLELEAFSAIRAIADKQEKALAVVDFGASATKVYIVEDGIIRSSHAISFGSQDITLAISRGTGMPLAEAERIKITEGLQEGRGPAMQKLMEGVVSYLSNETAKIIRDYEGQNGVIVAKMILSGGGVNLKGFPEFFGSRISMPIQIADPFSKLVAPAFLERLLKNIGPSYSVAIGAAIRALEEH